MKIYTADEITEMCDTWVIFNGFSGEICSKCRKTANTFAYSSGWFCDCGHYNIQSFYNFQISYENPDMGTPNSIIDSGYRNSNRYKNQIASMY